MKTYGLIGKSLSHSFSKKYFTEKFKQLNLSDCEYVNVEIPSIEDFPKVIEDSSFKGFNVTIPYKEQIIPYLDEVDEVAKQIGAVNTIVCFFGSAQDDSRGNSQKVKLIGYNTDVFGFHQSIKPFLKSQHEKALILGTGGVSKAVEYVLKQYGITVMFASRNESKGSIINWSDINENVVKYHLLIVNCTPLGMFPDVDSKPNIPYSALTNQHLLIDLVYNPTETLFLQLGKEKGAKILNGLSMLQQQAEKSWELWTES